MYPVCAVMVCSCIMVYAAGHDDDNDKNETIQEREKEF